jgi:lysophospholipase L1-like esterase
MPMARGGDLWTPMNFGATGILEAPFVGQSTNMAMSGSDIVSYTDPWTGSVFSRLAVGAECTLDTSVPMNGYASIRTSKAQSSLFSASAIGTGNQPFYFAILAQQLVAGGPNGSNVSMLGGFGTRAGVVCGVGSYDLTSVGGIRAWRYQFGAGSMLGSTLNYDVGAFEGAHPHFFEVFYDGVNPATLRLDGGVTQIGNGSGTQPPALNFAAGAGMGLMSWWQSWDVQTAHARAAIFRAGAPPTLSQADRVIGYYSRKYGHVPPVQIRCAGDSLTVGYGGYGASDVAHSYPGVLQTLLDNASKPAVAMGMGISGARCDAINAQATAALIALGSRIRRGVWVLFGGTNDAFHSPDTPTSGALMYSNLTANVPALKAAGWDIVICTMPGNDGWESEGAGRTQVKNDFNALITANSIGAAAVVPLHANRHLSEYPSSGTNYWFDTVHYLDVGYAEVAQAVYDAIVAAGLA